MATGIHILVQAETQTSAVGPSLRVLLGGLMLSASAGQPPVQEQVLSTPADTPVPIPVPEIAERLCMGVRRALMPGHQA